MVLAKYSSGMCQYMVPWCSIRKKADLR